jgi:hypothetical protein
VNCEGSGGEQVTGERDERGGVVTYKRQLADSVCSARGSSFRRRVRLLGESRPNSRNAGQTTPSRSNQTHRCATGRITPSWWSARGLSTVLAARGRVLLVDRSEVVADQLGPGPRAEIEAALDELGVERRLATTVTEIGDGCAVLSDGTKAEADAVVWSVGMRVSELTRQISDKLDDLDRAPVDQRLRALPEVFVAGTRLRRRSTPSTRSCRPAGTPPRSARSPGITRRPTCSTCRCAISPRTRTSPAWTWAAPVRSSPGAGTAK